MMVATSHPLQGHPENKELRKKAGDYLKRTREKAEMTQSDMAKAIGVEYYTMISQIENGKSRLPPDKMQAWAEATKTDPAEFAKRLLQYYDPFTWQMLFGR